MYRFYADKLAKLLNTAGFKTGQDGSRAALLACAMAFGAIPCWAASPQPGSDGGLVAVPPPGEPTLKTLDTKTTTRLWGTDPYSEAVAITQHLWTAARPTDAPGENDNVPDRPWGVILVTADDPLTAISAVPLVHFPIDAPILYVTKAGIPDVTLEELKRLGDTGIGRASDLDVIAVGEAANPGVLQQLDALKLKHDQITADSIPELANKIDAYYGNIQNADTGVPTMGGVASDPGNGIMDVMVGSTKDWHYILPATHWASHMPTGLLWVTDSEIPKPTIEALKRRDGRARIYVWGGPDQVSPKIVRELAKYGTVTRIDNDNAIVFNDSPKNDPITEAIAFAKMSDPAGMVGWNITGPGHGFTLVNWNDWQGAVASAPLSHMGFHAPLLLTDDAGTLPPAVATYLKSVAPTFLDSPAEGPYNMTYIVGDFSKISWAEQAHVDYISEMSPRRVWNQTMGGMSGGAMK